MMTEIARRLREKENWVVIELNPSTDLLQAMLAKLNSNKVCAAIIKSAKIDLHFFGFGGSNRRSTGDHRCGDCDYYNLRENEKEWEETACYH